MKPAVLFWVQHLLGSGHLRRIAAIARELAARDVETVVASGGFPLSHLDLGSARLVQLPALRAADADFSGLVDRDGNPADGALLARRGEQLAALVQDLAPAALVTETFPFGRRQLRHEALALLENARALARPPVVVCSVRDILQRPSKPERFDAMLGLALAHYDHILVHGDPALAAFGETFPHAGELGARLEHTGYIAAEWTPPRAMHGDGADEVVVSAGSGTTGAALLAAAGETRALSRRTHGLTWRLLSGDPHAPKLAGERREQATDGVIVEHNRADFRDLLARCRVSVSQGGYNTVTDLIATRARAVIVPYEGTGETEQRERAARLAGKGAIVMLEESSLDAAALAAAVDAACDLPRLSPDLINLDGARRSADLLLGWIGHG
jgi:predicted glycosyltransferase